MGADARRTFAVVERLRAEGRAPAIAEVRLVRLSGGVPPWTATEVELRAGEWVTLLASGRLVLAETLDLWLPPSFALWARVGGRGPLEKGTRDTTSFQGVHPGGLELALLNGEWASPDGELATPIEAYAQSSGTVEVVVVRWRGSAADGVAALASLVPDDALVQAELARLRDPIVVPAGWRPHWLLGPSECFHAAEVDGRPAIRIETANTVGIVRKTVDWPLGSDTTFAWRWRIDELPATGAEDAPSAHDYMSVALEFENGRDLTWYWSAALPVGTHYACPLPAWTARETHWVVRSGAAGLGRWHEERRRVAVDYRDAIGTPPARVIAAWLIAVSVFGHRRGRATVADLVLADGARRLAVV